MPSMNLTADRAFSGATPIHVFCLLWRFMATHDRISIDPDVMFGKPVIAGTRIPVEHIVRKLASSQSIASILDDHPHLEEEDVYAAVRFAADYMAQEDIVMPDENRL
jgi:uncharacterized protein (DUF433 family)